MKKDGDLTAENAEARREDRLKKSEIQNPKSEKGKSKSECTYNIR
jgi:hypothetical protein